MLVKFYPTVCGSVAAAPSSLGVRMHNAGYKAAEVPFTYLAMGADHISEALEIARSLQMRGLGVSMPHKQSIIDHLDEITDPVKTIGACNTVVFEQDRLIGYNTDWIGARETLEEAGIKPKIAEIIGAGGVARAIAYALSQEGARVFVLARRQDQATQLASDLRLAGSGPIESQGTRAADLVVNATPDATQSSPVILSRHVAATALFDVVFQQLITPLAAEALEKGLKVGPGWRMLLHQGCEQFRLYTGKDAPVEAMGKVLEAAFAK
jgi:shikimate dehydrogenase